MSKRYSILPAADTDLDEQAQYLSENASLDTALRFYDSAAMTFAFLAEAPTIGPIRETKNPALAGIRLWRIKGFENHLIFYRPTEDGIEIVRVLHGHRDIDAILGPEDGGE